MEHLILVAEDDPRTRESLSRAMTQAGYRTLTAADGAGALAIQGERITEQDETHRNFHRHSGL